MFQNHVGINLTETKFQLVEVSYKQNSFYLENVDQVIIKEGLSPTFLNSSISEVESKMIAILQESFDKIISKKPLVSKYISFCLPNYFFKIFEVPYDSTLTKKDLIEHFRWELSVLYPHLEKENFLIQHIEVNKTTARSEDTAVVLILDKKIVSAINKFCKENNLELKYIDNAHLSSIAFLYLSPTFSKDGITVSFYIDQNYSSFIAVEGIYPFYFKVFDTYKILDFIDEIFMQISKYGITLNSVEQMLICGQSITDEVIIKLENKLERKLKKINPFERLKTDSNIAKNPFYISQYNSFTAAAGIAIRII